MLYPFGLPETTATGTSLTLTTIDHEPRILDVDLAERLGLSRPRDIRSKLITPNIEELRTFGALTARAKPVTSGRGRIMDVDTYYLNEEQALLICLLSRTEKAKAVRAEVIRVFTAYRQCQLQQQQGAKFRQAR